MNYYGLEHNYGIDEPKREFLPDPRSPEMQKYRGTLLENFQKRINKALMK